MTVKKKLGLGFSAILFLLVTLAIATLILMNIFNENIDEAVNEDYDKIVLINRISNDINSLAKGMRNLILSENTLESSNQIDNIKESIIRTDVSMDALSTSIVNEEAQQIFNNLKINYYNYIEFLQGETTRINLEGKPSDMSQLLQDSTEYQTQLFDDIEELTSFYEIKMDEKVAESNTLFQLIRNTLIGFAIISVTLGGIVTFIITRNITSRLNNITKVMSEFVEKESDFSTRIAVDSEDEFGKLSKSFNRMAQWLQETRERDLNSAKVNQEEAWLKTNVAEISTSLQGNRDLTSLAKSFVTRVTSLVGGSHAVLYITEKSGNEEPFLKLSGSYGYKERKHISNRFSFGEGLVGQCALEQETIILTQVPEDYIRISSGLGESTPSTIILLPIVYEAKVLGVLEIASLKAYRSIEMELLEQITDHIGIVIENLQNAVQTEHLLQESQQLTEELQTQSEELIAQQEELERMNAELEQQTNALRESEKTLQFQQEELEQSNTELEEKAELLEAQNKEIERKSFEAEKSKVDLEEKAKQLELISKYKSEFLANMSHELRTPLNSLLILAKLLSENKEQNFTEKQSEFVKTIYKSGCDLLNLINEILDLSKVESGNVDVSPNHFLLSDVAQFVKDTFTPIANEKKLDLKIDLNLDLPKTIYTDRIRLEQILNNLLSNACKFTEQGEIRISILPVDKKELSKLPLAMEDKGSIIAFVVKDTGIGIPKDKQDIIFEAFQQADGTTSRKYGGTGLGLSITREWAALLGGMVTVDSKEGVGSTFTLYLPDSFVESRKAGGLPTPSVEIDSSIAEKEIAATSLEESDQQDLYNSPSLPREEMVPNSKMKNVLLVEDDTNQRNSMVELIEREDVQITSVSTGRDALRQLNNSEFNCMILDLGLTDMSGSDLLEEVRKNKALHHLPILIYTGKDLSSRDEMMLKQYAKSIIIKDVHSPERLLDELSTILETKNLDTSIVEHYDVNVEIPNEFEGKKILLIDDDVRNVFALSNMLEHHDMEVLFAEDGREGIAVLEEHPDVDLVLMDIMMPEMDGYQATREIRKINAFQSLPIIALTAKAMNDDRKKCLDAGASDYISKPVNNDQLLSLIRVWLYK